MKVSFLGDISLNNNYIELYKKNVNPFQNLESVLKSSDYVIGNLECMAEGDKGENKLKKPRLKTTTKTLNYLKNINLHLACLAHNHVYDQLENGYIKTVESLKEKSIFFQGAGFSAAEAEKPFFLDYEGIAIGFLNYVTQDTNPNIPIGTGLYVNLFDLEKCKSNIIRLKPLVNHIIVSLHWGGRVEGGIYPDWDQPVIARELIDAGASLIIGHHSHTVQPYEVYKGKFIFYSLGNFCFSDFWFENKHYIQTKRRQLTMIVNISFSEKAYNVNLFFFRNMLDHFQRLESYNLKILNSSFKIIMRIKVLWYLYYFVLKYITPIFLFLRRSDIRLSDKIIRIYRSLKRRIKVN